MRRSAAALITVLAATLLALGVAEGLLWALDRLGGPARGEVYDYGDVWREGGLGPGGFLREGFEGRVRDGYGGTVRWRNDAAGFRRDGEVARERQPGSLRILSLGDSFAAGYRVGQEETYSYLLEKRLEETGPWSRVEVLIAVVEDPPTGYLYLTTRGVAWQPDLVLLGVTLGNDIGQSYVELDPRGELALDSGVHPPAIAPNPGAAPEALLEELKSWSLPAGCFDPRAADPPRYGAAVEPGGPRLWRLLRRGLTAWRAREAPQTVTSLWGAYARPRLFDNNGLGMLLASPPPEIEAAYDRLFATLAAYRAFCASRGIPFAVALFPQRFQVQPRDWRATVEAYGLEPSCFDLGAPNRRIDAFCRRAGIPCLDPTEALAHRFAAGGESLYLPGGDMHFNARGHRAFHGAVADEMEALAADLPAAAEDRSRPLTP